MSYVPLNTSLLRKVTLELLVLKPEKLKRLTFVRKTKYVMEQR